VLGPELRRTGVDDVPGFQVALVVSPATRGSAGTDDISGQKLRVPTPEETLQIKGYLIVRRNQVRDYLDVAALSDRYGIPHSGQVLAHIDLYYTDQRGPDAAGVATQLARQLADPRPADQRTIRQLGSYKGLDVRWTDWAAVTGVCRSLAVEMTR